METDDEEIRECKGCGGKIKVYCPNCKEFTITEKEQILKDLNLGFLFKTITDLTIVDRHIKGDVIKLIWEYQMKYKTLTHIDLTKNEIGDIGAGYFGECLMKDEKIQFLNLSQNGITDLGAKQISEGIKVNKNLVVLKLSFNSIKDEGTIQLGNALKENTTLKAICLEANFISDTGIKYLQDSIILNSSLEILTLGDELRYKVQKPHHELEHLFHQSTQILNHESILFHNLQIESQISKRLQFSNLDQDFTFSHPTSKSSIHSISFHLRAKLTSSNPLLHSLLNSEFYLKFFFTENFSLQLKILQFIVPHKNILRSYNVKSFNLTQNLYDKLKELGFVLPHSFESRTKIHAIIFPLLKTSLCDILKNHKIQLETILKYGKELTEAVLYLHKQEVNHGNIKLENIMFSDSGDLILVGFGNAQLIGPTSNKEKDQDVYEVGIVLYEMLKFYRLSNNDNNNNNKKRKRIDLEEEEGEAKQEDHSDPETDFQNLITRITSQSKLFLPQQILIELNEISQKLTKLQPPSFILDQEKDIEKECETRIIVRANASGIVKCGSIIDNIINFYVCDITVAFTSTKRELRITVHSLMTPTDVKEKVRDQTGIPVDLQVLIFRGRQMYDGSLADSNVQKDSTIHLVLRKSKGG